MYSYEKIAKILRADKDVLKEIEEKMRLIVGHNEVLDKICEENEKIIKNRLDFLNVKERRAANIYQSLVDKLKITDEKIYELFERPVCDTGEGCKTLLNFAREISGIEPGFFIKEEKAKEFLTNIPPQNILKSLKYENVGELVKNENVFEIYSALRFMEDRDWLNNVFFKQYESLVPEDFEQRKIKVTVLNNQWKRAADNFLKKKYHNISHLKELGIIFVIPTKLQTPGETLRTFSLILHYFHEIDFYSRLFEKYAKEENFAFKLISSLRGDVLDKRFSAEDLGKKWLIVQRYLAKEDEYDWRLFEPHINPEAIHWTKAGNDIARLGEKINLPQTNFFPSFFFLGDFFPTETGIDSLVSFNMIDAVMDLVQQKEMIKYLYHHQEALWNKIFISFVGEKETEKLIIENFDKGFVEL